MRNGKKEGFRAISLKDFLQVLRDRYGFCVDQAPPGLTISNELLRLNRLVLERRLRNLGLLLGVNDAESMKRLTPRFRLMGGNADVWTDLHAQLFGWAIEKVLAKPDWSDGVRALPDSRSRRVLARDSKFAPEGWTVWRVADREEKTSRTITADTAVELRESKSDPALLLVDTTRCGAGMDRIYSAAQEGDENRVFEHARRFAGTAVTNKLSRKDRLYAERAIKKARGFGQRLAFLPGQNSTFWSAQQLRDEIRASSSI